MRTQITKTVAYTEVMHDTEASTYIVQWHDNVILKTTSKEEAIKEYNRIITRPGRDDYR